jgi:hypothetical protein
MESLLVADDDSSLEPIDTTEPDAYILSFFKKKETP